HPITLHNIARSYADLGQLELALEHYRLYQAAEPTRARDYDGVVAVLEARLQRQRELARPTPTAAGDAAAPPGGAVSGDEVARLREIAAELEALGARLAAGGPAPAPAPAASPSPSEEEAPLPEQSDLLSDAYERVVVTASRYGQSPLDSPSTVSILTAEDIRLSGAATLPDVLRRVAGVDVMTLSASQPDVSIRGFNRELANKVLVLVDGRSIYLDMLGTVLWETLPVALEEVERIEVIRGPGSAVYGANAVTGVINIITQAPGEGGSMVVGEAGGAGTLRGEAIASGRTGPTGWRLSTGYHELGRWETAADPAGQSALRAFGPDDATASKVLRANGRVDRAIGREGFASLSAGHSRGSTEYYVFGALGDYVTEFDHSYARADLGYGPVHLWGFFNRWAGPTGPWLEYQGERSLWTSYDARTLDLEAEGDLSFQTGAVAHRLNLGAGYRHKQVAWDYLVGQGEPIAEDHYNAFLQDTARLGWLRLIGSLRLDRHPLVALSRTISPRGAAILRLADRTSARLNVGTSFRSPSFMESYLELEQPTDADGLYVDTLGNTELLPERIFTTEAGLHDASSRWHELDLALYLNRVTDLIYVTDLRPEAGLFDPDDNGFSAGSTSFQNLPPVYTAVGGEVDGRLFPVDGLDLYANGAVERITEAEEGVAVVDGSTSLVKGNLGAMYRSPWRIDAAAHVQCLSAQTWRLREYDDQGQLVVAEASIPARAVLAAELAARPFADGALELSLSGWNLGALVQGQGFREHPKGQRVGPRVFGSATWRF
ncbi:TonB-dependent receptor, partial [Myxococcota bacterium]|nr:TonB-dependent receptor [Myxococcota bacterium]